MGLEQGEVGRNQDTWEEGQGVVSGAYSQEPEHLGSPPALGEGWGLRTKRNLDTWVLMLHATVAAEGGWQGCQHRVLEPGL